MLCQKCNKNKATFVYSQTVNGKSHSIALCDECKKKYLDNKEYQNINENFEKMYTDFMSDSFYSPSLFPSSLLFGMKDMLPAEREDIKRCGSCGATLYELSKGKRAFCPDCYSAFGDDLSEYLKRIHGASLHKGRRPEWSNDTNAKAQETKTEKATVSKIDTLREQLNQAIREERYEDAAKLRDSIKRLES